MRKLKSTHNLYKQNYKPMEFEGEWKEGIGEPQLKGCWFIWGNSSNGKTVFAAKLAKYLSKFGYVVYDSLEEGLSLSLKRAFQIAEIVESDKIGILDKASINELTDYLRKQKRVKISIIDSFQYCRLNILTYKALIDEFPNRLFIFISHADGKQPSGRTAKTVRYDANVKIWIEGYRAFPSGRYGGGQPITIWEEGAKTFYNEQ